MKNATKLFLLLSALLTLCVSPVLAQTSGSISGEVKDEKQAVVTNATVTVRNVKTNETRTTQTDGDGRYRFTGMPVGDYEISVESTGFAKYVQSGIGLVLCRQIAEGHGGTLTLENRKAARGCRARLTLPT